MVFCQPNLNLELHSGLMSCISNYYNDSNISALFNLSLSEIAILYVCTNIYLCVCGINKYWQLSCKGKSFELLRWGNNPVSGPISLGQLIQEQEQRVNSQSERERERERESHASTRSID